MKVLLISFVYFFILNSCRPLLENQPLSKNSFVVLQSRGHGMFSILDDVVSLLYAYEKQQISGTEISFGTTGLYYDKKKGPNWFTYYFAPLKVGKMTTDVVHISSLLYEENKTGSITHIEFGGIDKSKINYLIKKYIKIKPNIEFIVSNFIKNNFDNYYVIGVHYRGTDKISEAPRTSYDQVKLAIDTHVKDNNLSKYKIFIATDEQDFINFMQKNYTNICFQDAIRSTEGKPVHFNNQDPFRAGEEALTDMLLLAKTNYLIRTSSNLSRWSTYFNPDLKVLELNQRH